MPNRGSPVHEATPLLAGHAEEAAAETVRTPITASASTTTLCNVEGFERDPAGILAMAKQEAWSLTDSAIPVSLAYLLQFSFNFVNILSLGHLGAEELAAAALANMTIFMLINAPAVGLASALDTFCSTAFTASRDKTLVGFHLQRGLIAVTVHFFLMLPLMLRLEPLLVAVGQDAEIARLCAVFVRAQLAGCLPWMYFECVKRFLQAQGMMRASTYVLLAVLPLHLLNNYVFVWSPAFGFGFAGAAFANVVTFVSMFVGVVWYSYASAARAAWGGWTMAAVGAMPQYYRLAIPSLVMVCSDWAAWELMAIAASYLGNVTLAAQTIVINTCSLTYQIPAGLSIAISNRVGNLLGQARPRRAGVSAATGLVLGSASGLLNSVFCLAVAAWWGSVYSDDAHVIRTVAIIMPICSLFQLADAMNGVSAGVLRSIGRQNAGAWINFPSYYVIGFPLGLYLTYGAPATGVAGLWIGLCVGVVIAAIGQCWICIRTDFEEEVKRCLEQVSASSNKAQDGAAEER